MSFSSYTFSHTQVNNNAVDNETILFTSLPGYNASKTLILRSVIVSASDTTPPDTAAIIFLLNTGSTTYELGYDNLLGQPLGTKTTEINNFNSPIRMNSDIISFVIRSIFPTGTIYKVHFTFQWLDSTNTILTNNYFDSAFFANTTFPVSATPVAIYTNSTGTPLVLKSFNYTSIDSPTMFLYVGSSYDALVYTTSSGTVIGEMNRRFLIEDGESLWINVESMSPTVDLSFITNVASLN